MHYSIKVEEIKKKRGRPKKIFEYSSGKEDIIYKNFFQDFKRKKNQIETFNISNIFNDIFEKLYLNKEYNLNKNNLKKIEEHPILNSILNPLNNKKENNKKTCDEIFISYIHFLIQNTNKEYLTFSLSVILLLRECINKYKNIELEDKFEIFGDNNNNNIKLLNFTEVCEGEQIPEICNEYLTEFLPSYNYFGLNFLNNFFEAKNLIQHFCFWLYDNNYTSSKLIINNKND